MNKILVVLCTYNPKNRPECMSYLDKTIEMYKQMGVDVLIADNSTNPEPVKRIKSIADKHNIKAHCIIGRHPVQQAFNHSLKHYPKKDEYDFICYSSSDTRPLKLDDMENLANEIGDQAVISPQVTHNQCRYYPHLVERKNSNPTALRLGEVKNGHFYMMSREFMKAYDYKKVDVLYGHRMEIFMAFCSSAILKRELTSHRIEFEHKNLREREDFPFYDRPVIGSYENFFKMIRESKGYLGFEELYFGTGIQKKYVHMHNPECYKNGFPINQEFLYSYIKKNLFVPDSYYNGMKFDG